MASDSFRVSRLPSNGQLGAVVFLGFPTQVGLALKVPGAVVACVVRPRLASVCERAELLQRFDVLANSAAFTTFRYWRKVVAFPYRIWLFEHQVIVTENGIRILVVSMVI